MRRRKTDLLNSVIRNLPLPLVVCDTDGKILFLQGNIRDYFRQNLSSGKKASSLYDLLSGYRMTAENGSPVSLSEILQRNLPTTNKFFEQLIRFESKTDKSVKWFKIRSARILTGLLNGKLCIIISDHTDSKKKEIKYRFITYASNQLATSLQYDERLKRFARLVVPEYADWCLVDTVNNEDLQNVAVAYRKWPLAVRLVYTTPGNKNILGFSAKILRVYKSGKMRLYKKIQKNFFDKELTDILYNSIRKLEIHSVAIIPLIARGNTIGVVSFVRCRGSLQYDLDDIQFLWSLATKVALLVDNSRLHAVLRRESEKTKASAEKMKETEGALHLALTTGNMGLWDWKIAHGVIQASAELGKFQSLPASNRQYSFNEILKQIDSEYRGKVQKIIHAAIERSSTFECDFKITDTDGASRWIYAKGEVLNDGIGNPTRIIGVCADITNRKILENTLRWNEKKFKTIFENSVDAIFLVDDMLHVKEANQAVRVMLKTNMRDVLGKKMTDLLPGIPYDTWVSIKSAVNGSKVIETEFEQRLPTGEKRILELYAAPNILLKRSLLFVRDITEKKQEERRRRHFIAIASHELKSPLASVKAMIELIKLKHSPQRESGLVTYLNKIDLKVDSLIGIINDLLDISKINHGKLDLNLAFIKIDELITECIDEIKLTMPGRRIHLHLHGKKEIAVDRIRITQAIRNIVRNAFKYSPDKSIVDIDSKVIDSEIFIRVADRGRGIPESDRPRIFDLYYQQSGNFKNKHEGLGVGLFISAQIIKMHGGKLMYEPRIGGGSIFTIVLPLIPKISKQSNILI